MLKLQKTKLHEFRLRIEDTRVVKYSKVFVTYCTCCKACCKHNTQRVVNGVYLMLLNICEEESRFIIGRRNDRNEETMEQ